MSFQALPTAPFDGEVPELDLPGATAREEQLWAEAWSLPQAWAWCQPSQAHRLRPLRMWVRMTAVCETPDAKGFHVQGALRFAEEAGLSASGMQRAGWQVAEGDSALGPAEEVSEPDAPKRRLRAV